MTTYVPSTSAIVPAARPSSPSVRLTAFDQGTTTTQVKRTKPIAPIEIAVSRISDKFVLPGVSPVLSGNLSASTAKITAAEIWPMYFPVALRPRFRCVRSLM